MNSNSTEMRPRDFPDLHTFFKIKTVNYDGKQDYLKALDCLVGAERFIDTDKTGTPQEELWKMMRLSDGLKDRALWWCRRNIDECQTYLELRSRYIGKYLGDEEFMKKMLEENS